MHLPIRENLLSRRELAHHLKVNYVTVHNLSRAGKIPFIRVGGQYRYRLSDVIIALEKLSVAETEGGLVS